MQVNLPKIIPSIRPKHNKTQQNAETLDDFYTIPEFYDSDSFKSDDDFAADSSHDGKQDGDVNRDQNENAWRWRKVVAYCLALSYARNGNLEKLKPLVETYSDCMECENLARAACRMRQKEVLKYLLENFDIDVNKPNMYGFPLVFFAVWAGFFSDFVASTDHGEVLRFLVEEHGADVHHIHEDSGQLTYEEQLHHFYLDAADQHCGFHSLRCDWLNMWKSFVGMNRTEELDNLQNVNTKLAGKLYGIGCGGILKTEAKRRFDSLFEEENQDFTLLCKASPKCVTRVLDRFITVKPNYGAGLTAVSFALEKLYAPNTRTALNTPLATLMDTKNTEVFNHKAVKMVVALKWAAFGELYCGIETTALTLLFLGFFGGFVFESSSLEFVYAMRILAVSFSFYFLHIEVRECWTLSSFRSYFCDFWNMTSLACHFFILSLWALHSVIWSNSDESREEELELKKRLFTGPACILVVTTVAQHLKVLPKLSKFIVLIKLMVYETAQWMVLMALFTLAFSVAFYGMLNDNNFDCDLHSYTDSLLYVTTIFATSEKEDYCNHSVLNGLATLFQIGGVVLVAIIYLNILIALMTERFTQVSAISETVSIMELAEVLIGYERLLTSKKRQKYWDMVNPSHGEGPKTIDLRLGLGGDKSVGGINNGVITIAIPQGDEVMSSEESDSAILQMKKAIDDLKNDLMKQKMKISNLVGSTVNGLPTPSNSLKLSPSLTSSTRITTLQKSFENEQDPWKKKYLGLALKNLEGNSATLIQSNFRGWMARNEARSIHMRTGKKLFIMSCSERL